jgi:hypothetical protein
MKTLSLSLSVSFVLQPKICMDIKIMYIKSHYKSVLKELK